LNIELLNNLKKNSIDFIVNEQLALTNYLPPNLKYKEIQSCFLTQKNQFVSSYMILGYLESLTKNSLEIVKFKIKKQTNKQIFLISNNDCLTLNEKEIQNKKLNDFITSKSNLAKTGKIIIKNDKIYTIQKGRPYFFPNCKSENLISKTNLQYKIVPSTRVDFNFSTNRNIFLNYYNILKLSVNRKPKFKQFLNSKVSIKSEFSKLFLQLFGSTIF
jgi:hypothetical protein